MGKCMLSLLWNCKLKITMRHYYFRQLKSQGLSRQRGKTNVALPTITLMYNWNNNLSIPYRVKYIDFVPL